MYEIYFIYYRREDGFVQKIEVRKYDTLINQRKLNKVSIMLIQLMIFIRKKVTNEKWKSLRSKLLKRNSYNEI